LISITSREEEEEEEEEEEKLAPERALLLEEVVDSASVGRLEAELEEDEDVATKEVSLLDACLHIASDNASLHPFATRCSFNKLLTISPSQPSQHFSINKGHRTKTLVHSFTL
jgi:hypothetical protein